LECLEVGSTYSVLPLLDTLRNKLLIDSSYIHYLLDMLLNIHC